VSAPCLAVLDYGAANMVSVTQALAACGVEVVVASAPPSLASADGIVVPGVGAAGAAMDALRERELLQPLGDWMRAGRPTLGICLGFQIMLDRSDEGDAQTLGLIAGRTSLLEDAPTLPHIGWNEVEQAAEHPLFEGVPDRSHFYFVHSYAVAPADEQLVLARTTHGRPFVSAAASGCLWGIQFHPEKSGEMGQRILANFVRMVRAGETGRDR
jgi:imidazole glycerol-phosphate synthase subunit HisH